jgi:GT2 family glycosyltransferase
LNLSIIIVSYNVKHFLEQCLHSVQRAIAGINAEVVVVDNCSSDGSVESLQSKFPEVVFIKNKNNEGFAKACNIGLYASRGEYILFLNPDTLIAEDSLTTCLDFFKNHPDCGAIGVKMIDGSGNFLKESKRSFPSPITSLYKLIGLASLFPRSKTFARYHLGHLDENGDHEVDVLAGAFMMIPKVVLEKVGSFDEAFFMYGEDIDLSYRIQKAGYKNYYLAQTTIIHFKGESTYRESLKYVRLFYKAMDIFVQKHYKGGTAFLFRAVLQLGIWLRAVFAVLANFVRRFRKTFFSKKDKRSAPERSCLFYVANTEEWECIELFLASGLPFNLVGRNDSFAKLEEQLQQTKAEHLLLVAGGISYKDIIAQTKHYRDTFKYFHAYKSRSIVGSDESTTKGQSYTYPYKID